MSLIEKITYISPQFNGTIEATPKSSSKAYLENDPTDQKMKQWIEENSPDIYHTFDDGQLPIPHAVMERSPAPVVYDANDFTSLYGRYGSDVLESGIWLLENADGIVTKFPKLALDWYRDRGAKIKAPYLEYFDYCCPDFFQGSTLMIKTMKPTKDKNIVHGGATAGTGQGIRGSNNYHGSWLPAVLDQGYRFTVYTSPWDEVPAGYEHLENKYPDFHIFQGLNQPEIQKEMKYFHYGANIHDSRNCDKDDIFAQTAMSHKLSTYLEARLPIIVSDNLEWISEIMVDRLGVGFRVTFDDELASFREREEAVDYEAMRQKVLDVRENEFNVYKQVHRLMDFYRSLL